MNLFVLAVGVKAAAQAHGDKHVVKMLLEACQMLYTAHWTAVYPEIIGTKPKALATPQSMVSAPLRSDGGIGYRPAHINHPCTKWIRASLGNYEWAAKLALALVDEYEFRWPGRIHSCKVHAEWLATNQPFLPRLPRIDFAVAMDDIFKVGSNAIASYRNYYRKSKASKGLTVYTKRVPPSWLGLNNFQL
jgi:hypothetical protein